VDRRVLSAAVERANERQKKEHLMEIGLVGLPNVGKSTLFNALTSANAAASNFPFCTIEPNVGIALIADKRLDRLAEIFSPEKITPASIRFVDIAGLVKDAHKGEGLGNKFLAHIREVDAICHVVRCFSNPEVIHVYGDVDPIRDMELIDVELVYADTDTVARRLQRTEKALKADRKMQAEYDFLQKLAATLADGKPARTVEVPEDLAPVMKELCLLSAKPVIFAANVSEADLPGGNAAVEKLRAHGDTVVVSAAVEAEIAQMQPGERREFLQSVGLEESGLDRLARAAYHTLGLISFLTGGEKEVRAWPIRKGFLAPQAAGTIHTDFERGFIRAEIVSYEELDTAGSMNKLKEAGRLRLEGKDYVMQDGDVVVFRFNV